MYTGMASNASTKTLRSIDHTDHAALSGDEAIAATMPLKYKVYTMQKATSGQFKNGLQAATQSGIALAEA